MGLKGPLIYHVFTTVTNTVTKENYHHARVFAALRGASDDCDRRDTYIVSSQLNEFTGMYTVLSRKLAEQKCCSIGAALC